MSKYSLAHDIQQALLLFGVRSRLRTYDSSIRLSIQKADKNKFIDQIGFINSKKQNRARQLKDTTRSKNPVYGTAVAIRSIEMLEPCQMFDFVNSSTERFSANGFIVHNSFAAGVLKIAIAQCEAETGPVFRDAGVYVEPLMQIHDELLYEVDEDYVECVSEYFGEIMNNAVKLKVPLKSEAGWGKRWEK
jgi:DNA polymerase I-like protein with 3'-5' exonuclease and polymerase domains